MKYMNNEGARSYKIDRFREHMHIYNVNKSDCNPMVLSIGPLHHGTPSLQLMEKEKLNCLDYIISLNTENKLRDYIVVLKRFEEKARNFYSDYINMESRRFVQMLLLDGCFILLHFNGTEDLKVQNDQVLCENEDKNEDMIPIKIGRNYDLYVMHDVFLLENQIPFFIIESIYEELLNNNCVTHTKPLIDKIVQRLESIFYRYPNAKRKFDRLSDFHHMLHLCHAYFRPSQVPYTEENKYTNQREQIKSQRLNYFTCRTETNEDHESLLGRPSSKTNRSWRSASQYRKAGVQFRKRNIEENNPHSLLDIKFLDAIIEIPCLSVDNNTSPFFKNLIAFEKSCPNLGNDITAYVVFISQITRTHDDLTFLIQNGIITHIMDKDEKVLSVIKDLAKGINLDFNGNFYLKSVLQSMGLFYIGHVNKLDELFRPKRLKNCWFICSVLIMFIVFLCIILKAIFLILLYMKPQRYVLQVISTSN